MKAAFVWSFLGQYANFILQIVSVIVLARLLTPTELGAYAIGAAILSFAQTFKDVGITQYLVRETNLTDEKKQGALCLSWILCLSLSLVLYVIAEPVGNFYGSQELSTIIPYLAINILITPLSLLGLVHIKKEMRFKLIAFIETGAASLNLTVAISLALLDFGPLALVFASISGTLLTALMVNYLSGVKASLPKFTAINEVVRGMSFIAGINLLNELATQGKPLLIGKFLSESAVAIFDKGTAIVKILETSVFKAIGNVLLPLFSKLKKEGGGGADVYCQIVSISVSISWPFLLYVGLYSEPLVLILFGEQWGESAELVPYFCLASAFFTCTRNFNVYMISHSHDSTVFKISVVDMIMRIMILLFASPLGLLVLVKWFVFMSAFKFFLVAIVLLRFNMIGLVPLLRVLFQGGAVLLAASIPLGFIYYFDVNVYEPLEFVVLAFTILPFWLTALFVTKNIVVVQLLESLRKFVR